MRVEDENGEWRVSDKDPRLMVPGPPTRPIPRATYYRLYRKDLQGLRRLQGRSAPFTAWTHEPPVPLPLAGRGRAVGGGTLPALRAGVEGAGGFLARPQERLRAHTYHTFCGAILRPYSDRPDDEMPEHDLAVFKALGERGTQIRLPEHLRLPRLPLRSEESP